MSDLKPASLGPEVPDFHKHARGFGPVMGHEHEGGQRPHDHDLDGLRWGPPQFFTPDGLDAREGCEHGPDCLRVACNLDDAEPQPASVRRCPGFDWRTGEPRPCLLVNGHKGLCNGDEDSCAVHE